MWTELDRLKPSGRRRSRECKRAAGLLLLATLGSAGGGWAQDRIRGTPGAIDGTVVMQGTDDGIPGVEVRIVGTGFVVLTDERGRFRIDPTPPGDQIIRFFAPGYEVRSDSIRVPVGAVLGVTAALAADPIELDELTVVVRSAVLDRGGFYDRQSQGYRGYFLDRQDIERLRPEAVTDLFRRMSGIRVVHGGIYGSQVFVNQVVNFRDSESVGCRPAIWIDGIRSTMRTPDVMRVEELEGLEVYKGASSPGKFNDLCGVIVIWTRQRIDR